MSRRIGIFVFSLIIMIVAVLASTASAVAPTEEALAKWKSEGVLDQKLASWHAFLAKGGCSPSHYLSKNRPGSSVSAAADPNAVDTQQVLVLLVQFSDNLFTTPPGGITNAFDSILFSDKTSGGRVNPTGSMIDYYSEVTYGKLKLQGNVYGPYMAPNPYTYYVGTDNGFSHSPELVSEVLTLAQNDVPWATYAEKGTQFIPSVIVIHAGVGAEGGGFGIWSHKSSVGGVIVKGYSFGDYTMNPETAGSGLSAIGVFCHEYGHVLGLPDLYDTQYNPGSEGLGNWSLMASGNYNGNSQSPAHPDAWCKLQFAQQGLIDPGILHIVDKNTYQTAIPNVEFNPIVYEIPDSTWTDPLDTSIHYYSPEYFLVENRQQVGSDVGLPGSGLVIYHVDDAVSTNNNPARYHVGVMQADGLNQLNVGGSRGDAGDPWPGSSNNRNFDDLSKPDSRLNSNDSSTCVGVWNISNSGSTMYADFDYNFSRPYLLLEGPDSLQFLDTTAGDNNDSIIDAGETITFYCKVQNFMRQAYNWSVSLSCDDPDVQFLKNNVAQRLDHVLNPVSGTQKSDSAVVFQLAPGSKGKFATFTLTITADSIFHPIGDRTYSKSFQFQKMLGTPQVLLVDDDNGQTYQNVYTGIFQRLNIPYRIWTKATGSPTATDLENFKSVIWMQGARPTGTFTSADITAMKAFMDNGGNLAITGGTAASQLQGLDSSFVQNYLHAQALDSVQGLFFVGYAGDPIVGDSSKYRFAGSIPANMLWIRKLNAVNGGDAAFFTANNIRLTNIGNCGITYSGAYKSVFLTFGAEFLSFTDTLSGALVPDSLIMRIMRFFGGNATAVTDHDGRTLPATFALDQNYPNPFNPSTIIQYTIPASAVGASGKVRTELTVFNVLGQKIKTLVNVDQGPGNYSVTWDGSSNTGSRVASGVYLYRLTRGEQVASKKMVLLK